MGLSTLTIGDREKTNDNKENERPWYQGKVCRPVAFRATTRRRQSHN